MSLCHLPEQRLVNEDSKSGRSSLAARAVSCKSTRKSGRSSLAARAVSCKAS